MDDDDTNITARLNAPATQSAKNTSATALVRRHYDAIHAVCMKERSGGKTWEQIGSDLRPSDPILAGTVGRAFARVKAERARSRKGAQKQHANRPKPIITEPANLVAGEPSSRPAHPFAPATDPIRDLHKEGYDHG